MKRFAIASFVVSSLLVACGEKAPAPVAPAPVAQPEAKKAEDKPAEKAPVEAEKAPEPVEAEKAPEPVEAEKAPEPVEAEKAPEPAEQPVDADIPAVAKDWKVFEPAEGTFTIRAPGEPQSVPQETETDIGTVTYINHMFALPEGMLMVAWADLPLDPKEVTAAVEKKMFDGGRDGMIRAIKAKLIEEKAIELDGFRGRAYLMEIEVPDYGTAQNHVRTFLAGNRHYTLQGLGMGTGPKEAQLAFLDSFRITKKVEVAPE